MKKSKHSRQSACHRSAKKTTASSLKLELLRYRIALFLLALFSIISIVAIFAPSLGITDKLLTVLAQFLVLVLNYYFSHWKTKK